MVLSQDLIGDEQATALIQMLRGVGDSPVPSVLGGRSGACVCELAPFGRVFIKRYLHGGLLRAVTGGRFLALGRCRAQVEFEMLERVRSYGVLAPRPIAIIKRGALVYNTWLVMEELTGARSLVDIQRDDSEGTQRAMEGLATQLLILIRKGVFHIDLHPGNVLLSPDGSVHIVDFDKAVYFRGSTQALRDLYLRRWRRAVIKHGLSPVLSEMMSLTLRSYSE